MKKSDYYYGLMRQYYDKKSRYEVKKNSYTHFKDMIDNLKSSVFDAKESLDMSVKAFEGGGYVDGENKIANGKINESAKKTGEIIEILSNVSIKCYHKINSLKYQIEEMQRLYNEAYSNYLKALREEQNNV